MALSIRDAVAQTRTALDAAGVEGAHREARRIVGEASGFAPELIIAEPNKILPDQAIKQLQDFTSRRCAGEPLSRICGEREFYGRKFSLSPSTLDPRPDTETLVDFILQVLREEDRLNDPLRFIDVGTGTGALIVTLLAECPNAMGLATDISEDALATAQKNAERHGLKDRVSFQLTSGLKDVQGTFDIFVSNPPYIPSDEIAGLSISVQDYDPHRALDGGADGLEIYRLLAQDLLRVVPNGWAVFEVGAGQADDLKSLLKTQLGTDKIRAIHSQKDLGGHIRCVAAATHCSS